MIRSFRHRGLKRLYEREDRSGIRPDLVDTVERILTALDTATSPQGLNIPRYRLHPLKGDLKAFGGCHGTGQLAHYLSVRRGRRV